MKKKLSKEYKNMCKKYSKDIMKDAKLASKDPFDWFPGLKVFVDHLYFMREYYRLGENVWAQEDENAPTREQCLNMILAEYEDWQHCEDKYYEVVYKEDSKAFAVYSKVSESREETGDLFLKEYNYHRKRFFELLSDYIEFLWD